MLDMCDEQNIIIVNREIEILYECLDRMSIDEVEGHSLGSDHKRIQLNFGNS